MSALASIPIIKQLIAFIRGGFIAEHLQKDLENKTGVIEMKDKEIAKLRRRLKKLERL